MLFRGKVLYEKVSESFLKSNIGSPNKTSFNEDSDGKTPAADKKKHLRKEKN